MFNNVDVRGQGCYLACLSADRLLAPKETLFYIEKDALRQKVLVLEQ